MERARMRHVLLVLAILSCPSWPAYAATITAASCALSAVQAAVNSAVRTVDTVQVPACAATTWNGTLNITKGFTLQGAGAGSTFITATQQSPLISVNPDSQMYGANERLEILGFSFTNNYINTGASGSIIDLQTSAAGAIVSAIVIHDNIFTATQNSGGQPSTKALQVIGGVYGV